MCVTRIGVDWITFLSSQVMYALPYITWLHPAALLPTQCMRVVLIEPGWQQAEWWPLVCTVPTVSCGKGIHCVKAAEANLGQSFGPS
jgi:hypothetical protein